MHNILMVAVEIQFSARSTAVAYEHLQLCVVDAADHERVDVAQGDHREGDRHGAQLQQSNSRSAHKWLQFSSIDSSGLSAVH